MSEPIEPAVIDHVRGMCALLFDDEGVVGTSALREILAEYDAVKQRADAAEAERDLHATFRGVALSEANALRYERDALMQRAEAAEANAKVFREAADFINAENTALRAECDALRKDAARYREAIDIFLSFQGSTREPEGQAALDAALAVQPNALRAQEGA